MRAGRGGEDRERGLEVGSRWATEGALDAMAGGWEGRDSGKEPCEERLGPDHGGLSRAPPIIRLGWCPRRACG